MLGYYALNPFDCSAFRISVTSASMLVGVITTLRGRRISTVIFPSAMLIATSPADLCDTSQRSWYAARPRPSSNGLTSFGATITHRSWGVVDFVSVRDSPLVGAATAG